MLRFLKNQFVLLPFLMDETPPAGGTGTGTGTTPPASDPAKELADLKASNAALMARLEKLEKPAPTETPKDDDLATKARLKAEEDAKKAGNSKDIEKALSFNLSGKEWVKTNASLLPKSIEGIFAQAEKETYDSAIEKASAIKVGIVSEFFSQQSNLDLLTGHNKNNLEDFLKLTKNGKQEKAQHIYDTVFEPAFEMLKRIKKAEQLHNAGAGTPSDAEAAYRDKLIKGSRSHYLGEKQ